MNLVAVAKIKRFQLMVKKWKTLLVGSEWKNLKKIHFKHIQVILPSATF